MQAAAAGKDPIFMINQFNASDFSVVPGVRLEDTGAIAYVLYNGRNTGDDLRCYGGQRMMR